MSRRAHIKRAKILRGRFAHWGASAMSFRSRGWRPGLTITHAKQCRRTRKCSAHAQAMRGYYHD